MKSKIFIFSILLSLQLSAQNTMFYVGTTDNSVEKSISVCSLNEQNGEITLLNKTKGGVSPGYIALSANHKYLYAVSSKVSDSINKFHSISAFEIIDNGKDLKLINEQSSEGLNPCHIYASSDDKFVFTANYSSGNATAFPVGEGGKLMPASSVVQHSGTGPDKSRQEAPHAHYIQSSHDNKYVFVVDLGIDKVMIYSRQPDGKLAPNSNQEFLKLPAGAGPRHLVFHQSKPLVFVLNELNSTVTSCQYNSTNGTLSSIETHALLPDTFDKYSKAAAIRISPNGKYLYCTNRGYNSIVVFGIKKGGKLQKLQTYTDGMGWLRDINISPSGKYMIAENMYENEIVVLKIESNGKLTATGKKLTLPNPVCVVFRN